MPTRIDVHHHYLPDFYVCALEIAGRSPPDGIPATPACIRSQPRLLVANHSRAEKLRWQRSEP